MIKRIAIFSLLLVYLSTTAGFALTLHFCGTKISTVQINQSKPKPCCTTEAESKPDKCCKDKHLKIKVSDNQQAIQSAKVPAATNHNLYLVSEHVISPLLFPSASITEVTYRGPPDRSSLPLTIKNCVFRI